MIHLPNSQNDTTSPLIHSVSEAVAESPSTSTILSEHGYQRLDLAVARVMVKRLVEAGYRKGPSELLVLPQNEIELWYDQEAVRFLDENLKQRQANGN